MKTEENSLQDKDSIAEKKIDLRETEKQKQLNARKRIEDYLAEKQLKENIGDFDFGY